MKIIKNISTKLIEGATNSDIFISIRKMIENTYYKNNKYDLINEILAETLVEHFDSLFDDSKPIVNNLISKLKKFS